MGDDLNDEFERCAWAYEHSKTEPVGKRKEQAELYGLFKQARVGDINVDQPGFFNFEDRANYQAWKDKKGMPAEEARRRFVSLAKKLGYEDPGESPVPWISNETWLREESWGVPEYDKKHRAVDGAKPLEAVDFDRQIAPTIASSERNNLPPTGTLEEQKERLDSPPKTRSLRIYSPIWPVCCQRLTSLVGHHGMDEVFESVIDDVHHLRAEVGNEKNIDLDEAPHKREKLEKLTKKTNGDDYLKPGKALYHCGDCGSVYLASCED